MLQLSLQLKLRDLAGQALAFIQELVTALLNFHTYTEQKVQIFPIDSATDTISPLNQKVKLTDFSYAQLCRLGVNYLGHTNFYHLYCNAVRVSL